MTVPAFNFSRPLLTIPELRECSESDIPVFEASSLMERLKCADPVK
jgi:hypothetical protein